MICHIFFTINNAYCGYLATCIISIIDNLDENYTPYFYIINSDISEQNKEKIQKLIKHRKFYIEFIQIDQNLFKNLPNSSQAHIKNETNYRFLASSLKPNLDKCIFLDVDLVVIGDIAKLWEIEINDYYIAAVSDQAPLHPKSWTANLPLPFDYTYINTGVALFNLKKWRENNIEHLLFENSHKFANKLLFPDQDTLNIVLYQKVKYLSSIYNAMPVQNYYNKDQEKEAFSNPQIIHWAGYKKPWKYSDAPYAEIFWHYAKKTPFYEEILFNNISNTIQNNISNLSISNKTQGAVDIIKTHLSYKLGNEILSIKKSKIKIIFLPFTLFLIFIKHKLSNSIYKLILNINPNLKPLNLEKCQDYQQALQIKNYLSYKLGNTLVKHPFTFIFRVNKIYKEWKNDTKSRK
ncbi:glycosyltransferase family 8 protein [Campylobacter armoricus]|uniref:glycosyltransferase family 8 protein n=1 Tax=Campylobacter armoricus TaxID=2505970 RepID=UPI00111696CF|nr:glycosyltransferase family 8 protein [Campylobacter armoricus]